jgi:hypothetical protein
MEARNARGIAVAGVIGAAVLATFLLMPSVRQLGGADWLWLGAAIMIVPTAAVLTATGYGLYGLWRSLGMAVAVMVITSVITWVVAVFTFAAALSESPAGTVLGIVLFATPAVCVLVFGLLAIRFVPVRSQAAEQPQSASHADR